MLKRYIISPVLVIAAMALLSGCLKESGLSKPNLDPEVGTGSPGTIGIDKSGAPDQDYSASAQSKPAVWFYTYNLTVKFFPKPDTGYINVNVSYFGPNSAPQDITVGLDIDQETLTAFNQNGTFKKNWGANAELPDASDIWSIPKSVVIPKGQKTATVQIKLKNTIGIGDPYIIPLKITSVSSGTISQNTNRAAYLFQGVNKYDGLYMVNGNLTDANKVYTGRYPKYVELITLDAKSVTLLDQNYGAFYYIGNSIATGGAANLGGVAFRFDPATDKVTNVGTPLGASNPNVNNWAYGTLGTGAPNQFAPQTSSYSTTPAFKVNYTFSAGRYNVNDIYTYVGERSDAN